MDTLKIKPFKTVEEWGEWMQKHSAEEMGIWVRFYKKASGHPTVTYAQALEVALCYGWIDSQVKSYDEVSYIQKFTPRGPRSIWSQINTKHIERLIKEGKMQPAGLAAVEAAKADGRWAKAYPSPKDMKVPEDFLKELSKNKKAESFFQTLSKSNLFTISWHLHTAKKAETRERRMKTIIDKLERGEKFH